MNLTPKTISAPLAGGTLGHEAFQFYAEAIIEGHSHDKALMAGQSVFTNAMRQQILPIDLILKIKLIWDRYMAYHNGWPEWEVLGTEERLDLPLTEEFSMPMRYDLKIRDRTTGLIRVLDFKFTYDFWSASDHDLNSQMPKYIFIMNANGGNIHGGYLEEIRTRPLGDLKASDPKNLFRRTPYNPSLVKKQNTIRQQISASLEIIKYQDASPNEKSALEIPVLNKHGACKLCNFKDLCASELDGKTDLSVDISSGYVQNTYGYNGQSEEIGDI